MMLKSTYKTSGALLIAGTLLLCGCDQPTEVEIQQPQPDPQKIEKENGKPIEGQYIVVFAPGKLSGTQAEKARQTNDRIDAITQDYNIPAENIMSRYAFSLYGFAGKLTNGQLAQLRKDDRINYIEQDRIVMLSPPRATNSWLCILFGIGCDTGGGGPQEIPYGIERVGGPADGSGLTAWVIDTGVDLDHDDLNVDTQQSISFALGEFTADDGNGHGTHVSGTIAALDNDIDVVGVAAGATIVGVKVLNRFGSGTTSDVIEGIDYVAANANQGDVANMSLGGGASQALDDAVRNTADNGIYFAIAAGNDSDDANNYSPARVEYANVWTISAIDDADDFASFSNYSGPTAPPIEYAAPGVDVKSLWKNNGVNTISGTSMATPHAAGVLLLTGGNPTANSIANGDPDGDPDPIIHN